jgi:DnaJ-class molecular chaperone
MDAAMMEDVMSLVRRVDMDKLISDVKASDATGDNIDSMIATMTKTMLQTLQVKTDTQHTLSVSLTEAHTGKKRKIRVRSDGASHTHEVLVPKGCADKQVVRVQTEHGPVSVETSVPACEGAFTRVGDNLSVCIDVSLQDTRRLNVDIKLPWGEVVRISESDRPPLAGWLVVRGAGMNRSTSDGRGDLFVYLRLQLPATWEGIDISSIGSIATHTADLDIAPSRVDVPSEDELSSLRAQRP